MLRLLIIAGVIAAVFCDDKPCCPPEKWEGIQAGQGGYLAEGKPQILTTRSYMAIDRLQERVFSFLNTTSGTLVTSQKIYQDYKQNVQYVYDVQRNTCARSTVAQDFNDGCLPRGSKYMGRFTVGAGTESVKVKSYSLHMGSTGSTLDAAITVTEEQCVPVGENIVGLTNKVPMTMTYGFVNVTVGIRDPSIFTPPSICKQNATGLTKFEPQVQHHFRVF